MLSSVLRRPESSRRSQPISLHRREISRRASPFSSIVKDQTPSSSSPVQTVLTTCGRRLSACSTSARGAAMAVFKAGGSIARASSSGVPSATRRPLLMIKMRLHVASISCRICEESRTVWLSPRFLIRLRISIICFGSKPTVGSSRIKTGGSPKSACARPTRWR